MYNHRYLIQLSLIICVMLSDVKHLYQYLYDRLSQRLDVDKFTSMRIISSKTNSERFFL